MKGSWRARQDHDITSLGRSWGDKLMFWVGFYLPLELTVQMCICPSHSVPIYPSMLSSKDLYLTFLL